MTAPTHFGALVEHCLYCLETFDEDEAGDEDEAQREPLNRVVDRARKKAVSDRRERKVQRHALRRFDDQNFFSCDSG